MKTAEEELAERLIACTRMILTNTAPETDAEAKARITALARRLVEDEREACASLVEESVLVGQLGGNLCTGDRIAAVIRARG